MIETLKYPKETKAKKDHICDLCSCKIRKGQKYIKSTFVHDYVYDWKVHTWCNDLSDRLLIDDGDGITGDYFKEAVHDKHDEILISMIQNDGLQDVKDQIRNVKFVSKLGYLIRYFKKSQAIDNQS